MNRLLSAGVVIVGLVGVSAVARPGARPGGSCPASRSDTLPMPFEAVPVLSNATFGLERSTDLPASPLYVPALGETDGSTASPDGWLQVRATM